MLLSQSICCWNQIFDIFIIAEVILNLFLLKANLHLIKLIKALHILKLSLDW
jgi:hypothetical protein